MNHATMQEEIKKNGPMMVGLDIYGDLYNYASGVYTHVSGALEGGHAVKLIGWYYGPTTNELIWICQNQWGTSWGEQGFFNILTGEAGLDMLAWSCEPDV